MIFENILAIKQTVDSSKCGIIAIKNNNKVLFRNSTMYKIMNDLNIHSNYIEDVKQKAIKKIGNDYVLISDGKAYLFCISKDEKEITAFDIDEEYSLQRKLEEQNKILNENNKDIIWAINNLEDIEKEEKTLKIKNKFHDLLGQRLSVLQAYLNQDINESKKFDDVKFMIQKMFVELEDVGDSKLNLQNFIKINENIGVKINIEGNLPEDEQRAKVLLEIIREAVTNAIRHADSNEVNIKIEEYLNLKLKMTIINNGKKPKEVIIENEGIKGIRRKINKLNGSLFINTVPYFKLTCIL